MAAGRAAAIAELSTLRALSLGLEGMLRAALAARRAEGKTRREDAEDGEVENDDPDDLESKAAGIAVQADELGAMLATIDPNGAISARRRDASVKV